MHLNIGVLKHQVSKIELYVFIGLFPYAVVLFLCCSLITSGVVILKTEETEVAWEETNQGFKVILQYE